MGITARNRLAAAQVEEDSHPVASARMSAPRHLFRESGDGAGQIMAVKGEGHWRWVWDGALAGTLQNLNALFARARGEYVQIALRLTDQGERRRSSTRLNRYAQLAGLPALDRRGRLETIPGVRRSAHRMSAPKTFSFLDDPEAAFAFTNRVAQHAIRGTTRLFVNQLRQINVDLGACLLLNAVASAASKEADIDFAGLAPRDDAAREIVTGAGLPSLFAPGLFEASPVRVFQVREGSGMQAGSGRTDSETACTKLVEYIAECFRNADCWLDPKDAESIRRAMAEVLTNAEEHGDGDWLLAGYMLQEPEKSKPEKDFGVCYVSVLNFGRSIAETMQDMPTGAVRTGIGQMVDLHSRKGYFRRGWTPNALWTHYALQEGYTSRPSPGGAGLAVLLESFSKLGETDGEDKQPQMCLVSGDTYFRFDGSIRSVMRKDRRMVFLNREEDLGRPPQAGVVRQLSRPFPGTLISIRIFLDALRHAPPPRVKIKVSV